MNERIFANSITSQNFNGAPKKKFNSKSFHNAIQLAWLAGACSAVFEILDDHRKNPVDNADELLGDIQLKYHEYGNRCIKNHLINIPGEMTLEDIMSFTDNNHDAAHVEKLNKGAKGKNK